MRQRVSLQLGLPQVPTHSLRQGQPSSTGSGHHAASFELRSSFRLSSGVEHYKNQKVIGLSPSRGKLKNAQRNNTETLTSFEVLYQA